MRLGTMVAVLHYAPKHSTSYKKTPVYPNCSLKSAMPINACAATVISMWMKQSSIDETRRCAKLKGSRAPRQLPCKVGHTHALFAFPS